MTMNEILKTLDNYTELLLIADKIVNVVEGHNYEATEVRKSNGDDNYLIVDCYDTSLPYYVNVRIKVPVTLFTDTEGLKDRRID